MLCTSGPDSQMIHLRLLPEVCELLPEVCEALGRSPPPPPQLGHLDQRYFLPTSLTHLSDRFQMCSNFLFYFIGRLDLWRHLFVEVIGGADPNDFLIAGRGADGIAT